MTRPLGFTILIVFAALSIAIAAAQPNWVSDQNSFLKNFVNHEFLGLLGVILAITLASVASIHLEFNKIEEKFQKRGLTKSRQNLSSNTYWLIGLFVTAISIVTIKPIIVACCGVVAEALFNMAALLVVLWHVLILISLTQLVFAMEPDIKQN